VKLLAPRTASVLLGLVIAATAGSCASSSGGGISGTSLVSGPISAFGSIILDGIEFDTTNAVVTIEGDPAEIGDLRLGMFVFVRGKVNDAGTTGVAERIASDHLLNGPVDAVNVADGTFTALDQLVITDANTVFDQITLDTLAPGDVVEVFGVLDADASIRATRVTKIGGPPDFEVTGVISQIDTAAQTFKIGVLTVDYSEAEIENAPTEGLSNGLVVEVGMDDVPVNDFVMATGVEVRTLDVIFDEGDGAKFRGFITALVSATEFVINHTQHIVINDATTFDHGDQSDIALNAEVDVEGVLQSDGTVVANEVDFLLLPVP